MVIGMNTVTINWVPLNCSVCLLTYLVRLNFLLGNCIYITHYMYKTFPPSFKFN